MQYKNFVDVVLPDDVWQSVMDMTRECASGLFLEPMSESHPLFNWQLTTLEEEYNNYMIFTVPQMITDVGRFSTGVVLARDPERECAAGFVLYSRDFRNDEVVGIIGIAVRKEYRLQGVMKEMIKKLRQSARDIGLSCSLGLVRAYHGLGFEVRGEQGAQVRMGWGGPGGEMARFQEGSFNKLDSVQAELSLLHERLGESYGQVFSDRIGEIEAETLKVKNYIQKWQDDPSLLP
ncbi:GNAT family N-acetyltransferase [Pseudomonas baetica]|uniref:GNAT family N-acetyltransferase n=1 Tax=Pseudomonas baetica TaxID=674054 RepID=UPI00240608D7|nr:GNAT family N-acetyltransferase [Pseudomonas baetica]MDF9779280.1 GNAT superfamily N-acetyltransferase [Pseudomonas baetica]